MNRLRGATLSGGAQGHHGEYILTAVQQISQKKRSNIIGNLSLFT